MTVEQWSSFSLSHYDVELSFPTHKYLNIEKRFWVGEQKKFFMTENLGVNNHKEGLNNYQTNL